MSIRKTNPRNPIRWDRLGSWLLDQTPRQLLRRLPGLPKKKGSDGFDQERPCVFVLSTGRTGTETLAALCRLSNRVFACHEPTPLLYRLSKSAYDQPAGEGVWEALAAGFLTARDDQLRYALSCGRGYVETSPQGTFLAPAILASIPSVRFLHLVRDPRDVVRSGMRRRWYAGHSMDETRITPRSGSSEAARWGSMTPFQKNVWLWAETNRWILEFCAGLPADRVLCVQAQRLFVGDPEVLRGLFAFIGSPMPTQRRIQRVLGKVLNGQRNGSFPSVADWTSGMQRDLIDLAGGTAERLGFDF